MNPDSKYNINTAIKFGPLELIDIPVLIQAREEKWWNQTLCQVNNCVVRLGVIEGEFHWHKHDNEDEFFYVIDGHLYIDIDKETIELKPQQGFLVPRGVFTNQTQEWGLCSTGIMQVGNAVCKTRPEME